jgi:hypothetical protein
VEGQRHSKRQMAYIAVRLARYPLIPVITQTFNLVDETCAHIKGSTPEWILLIAYVLASIQGLLYAVALLYDPAFTKIVRAARIDLYHYYETHETGWRAVVAYRLGRPEKS